MVLATPVLMSVSKTVAFDGGANNGNVGDEIPLFTLSAEGQALVVPDMTVVECTENMVSANLQTGLRIVTPGSTDYILQGEIFNDGQAGEVWSNGNGEWRTNPQYAGNSSVHLVNTDLKLLAFDNGGGADITDGTIIVTLFYWSVRGGTLTGDDASEAYEPARQSTLTDVAENVTAILSDSDELQSDWVDGGRLDLLMDAVKAKTDNLPSDPADQSAVEAAITAAQSALGTSIGDLPTNAELATALASADDATLAAIAALNDLDSTAVQTAAAAALTAYDPPTKAELDTAQSAIEAAVAALASNNQLLAAQAGAATTITLHSTASAEDDAYNGMLIILLEGSGADAPVREATRRITDYVGSTKVATVDSAWASNPASGTRYLILGAQ